MSASPLFPDETKLTFDGQIMGPKHGDKGIQQHQQNGLLQARLIELSHDAILVRDPGSAVISWNRSAVP